MKILRVGDAHVKIHNMDDCHKLLQFILDTARSEQVDAVEFLGDLFDNHAILRSEIVNFWDHWFRTLSKEFHTIAVLGNHDMSHQKELSSPNALSVYRSLSLTDSNGKYNLTLVLQPMIIGQIAYLPYIHDPKEFVEKANSLQNGSIKALVCHGEFDVSKTDNKMFFTQNGVDLDLLNFEQVISGHIHKQMECGKLWYIGTPKWESTVDCGENKGIFICEHDETGLMISKKFISTYDVVTPIIALTWKEGEEQPQVPQRGKISMELVGSNLFISKAKGLLKGTVKIQTKVTDKVIRENRKPSKSIYDFLQNNWKSTENKDKIVEYLKGKGYV